MQKILKMGRYDAALKMVSSIEASIFDDWKGKRPNASLTLTLRLGFRQINPTAGADKGTYHDLGDPKEKERKIVRWNPTVWSKWKSDFVTSAQKFWDNKFCLINNRGHFPFELDGQILIPNVKCRLKIVAQDATAKDNHHTIDVVRLAAREKWFRSHASLYDSRDTKSEKKGKDSKGKKIMQRAHVHEVGHLLGLHHVDVGKAHCPATGDTNKPKCYGVADHDQYAVMGRGMELRKDNARPWHTALTKFEAWAKGNPAFSDHAKAVTAAGLVGPIKIWSTEFMHYHARTLDEVKAGSLNFGMLEPAGA